MEPEKTSITPPKITSEFFESLLRNQAKIKRPLSSKSKLYIDKYPTITEAFASAKFEDNYTLKEIFYEGVRKLRDDHSSANDDGAGSPVQTELSFAEAQKQFINFDIDIPNKLNMFHCAITVHGACNPYFLDMMFRYGRKDIEQDGQHVFEMACAYGDTRHIDVFMKYAKKGNFMTLNTIDPWINQLKFDWDLHKCMKSAVMQDNLTNFHHLQLYASFTEENKNELWNIACGEYRSDIKVMTYMYTVFKVIVTDELLKNSLSSRFCNTLQPLIYFYLKDNKPFDITKGLVDQIILGTDDRLIKLRILDEYGFNIEGYDEIKRLKDTDLPKASCTRYFSNTM